MAKVHGQNTTLTIIACKLGTFVIKSTVKMHPSTIIACKLGTFTVIYHGQKSALCF
jgi:hypothetical protein